MANYLHPTSCPQKPKSQPDKCSMKCITKTMEAVKAIQNMKAMTNTGYGEHESSEEHEGHEVRGLDRTFCLSIL